jgi:hypothetical protein
MIRMIVLKGVVALYARHRAEGLWPRADVMSLNTICSVCSHWCNMVIGSKRSRWKIQYLLDKVISNSVRISFLINGASTLNRI